MGDFTASQSEDCLSVTVWTPGADAKRRPVIVWLHGGGYSSGAGALDWYAGDRLSRDGDVVVVGVNYRLGALGYLYLPELVPGNLGLLDQEAALRWVAANIPAFGGDPDNVTVVGQSAGGHSIACLLTRPSTAKLFHRAILQSAPLGMRPQNPVRAAHVGRRFLQEVKIDPGAPDVLARLRAVPVADVLAAQGAVARSETRLGDSTPPFQPVGDDNVLPATDAFPAAWLKASGAVDMIIGTVREEMASFYTFDAAIQAFDDAALTTHVERTYGRAALARLDRLRRRRPGGTPADLLGDLETEDLFLLPSLDLAAAAAGSGRNAYVYQFDWPSPLPGLSACHCLELPFLLGAPSAWADSPMVGGVKASEVAGLSRAMQGAWLAFARSGDPNHRDLPVWPRYDATDRFTMRFDRVCGAIRDLAGRGDPA